MPNCVISKTTSECEAVAYIKVLYSLVFLLEFKRPLHRRISYTSRSSCGLAACLPTVQRAFLFLLVVVITAGFLVILSV